MYLVKNPELPISQKILTTIGIDMASEGKQKAIDPNCTNYFDGCNTCMVSGGIIGGCTKMFCETPAEPQCLEYKRTGMDLTNCISYFDGCNNCTVENGKPSACTLMYCETPTEPKCNEYASGAANNGTVGMVNPASMNCVNNGGTLEIVTEANGGQIGMCTLKNGTVCEERAYMRGECGKNNTVLVNDFTSCVQAGNPVMESYPRQCAHKGKNYTEVIEEEPTACTMDAKACPDGSYVGRVAPDCEFAPCPSEESTACTMEYAPVCASVAVQCIKAPCPAIEQTFGNECMMNANKLAKFLHKGECTAK